MTKCTNSTEKQNSNKNDNHAVCFYLFARGTNVYKHMYDKIPGPCFFCLNSTFTSKYDFGSVSILNFQGVFKCHNQFYLGCCCKWNFLGFYPICLSIKAIQMRKCDFCAYLCVSVWMFDYRVVGYFRMSMRNQRFSPIEINCYQYQHTLILYKAF